jgi:hypothetical protein
MIIKLHCQATCHSQMLGSHSYSTRRHHPIGYSRSSPEKFLPTPFGSPFDRRGWPPCLHSHLVVKSRVRSIYLSTRTHVSNGSFTSTPLTQSSIFASRAWIVLAIGLARRRSRRRIHLPGLASSQLMIPLVVRPGAKLPLSPTTFCVLPPRCAD